MPETPGHPEQNIDQQQPCGTQQPYAQQPCGTQQPFGTQQPYAEQQPPAPQQPYAAPQQYVQQPYGAQPYAAQQTGFAPRPPAGFGAPAAPQPVKKSKLPWIALIVCVALLVFGITFTAASCSSMFAAGMADDSEVAATTGDTVAVIDMGGTIQYDGSSCSPEGLRDLLDQAEANPDIKAIVLRVNSGGGVAAAGEEMAYLVAGCSKPIVVSTAGLNASAAYEISSQADYIFVNRTSEIGAIGTIMQLSDMSGLYDMLGIDFENIASAESKDSSYGTRPLTDEERTYYQNLVNEINEAFLENVAAGRGMSMDEVRALATGLTFAGETSVANGLADEVGTYDDALEYAADLGGITGAYDVVSLYSPLSMGGLFDLLGSSSDMSAEELVKELEMEGIAR